MIRLTHAARLWIAPGLVVGLATWLMAGLAMTVGARAADEEFRAGRFIFSDELGGFEILSISGSGSHDDPVIITQRIVSLDPVTVTVRVADPPLSSTGYQVGYVPSFVRAAVTIITVNETRLPWIGFDFELQQSKQEPSVYSDGLSFDQINSFSERPAAASRFHETRRDSEPYDRLRYRDGGVNSGESVTFEFNLLDVTPVPVFYLLQQPILPTS
ncbi:MAG: hypothetical protein AAF638_01875 [Pseudomonadota bacterium]